MDRRFNDPSTPVCGVGGKPCRTARFAAGPVEGFMDVLLGATAGFDPAAPVDSDTLGHLAAAFRNSGTAVAEHLTCCLGWEAAQARVVARDFLSVAGNFLLLGTAWTRPLLAAQLYPVWDQARSLGPQIVADGRKDGAPTPSRASRRLTAALAGLLLAAAPACDGNASGVLQVEPGCAPQSVVRLEAGAARLLNAVEARCIQIDGPAHARYLLAGMDSRGVHGGTVGADETVFTIRDATRGVAPGAAGLRIPAPSPGAPVSDRFFSTWPDDPFARSQPWTADERFTVGHPDQTGVVSARVLRIVNGRYVIAAVEANLDGPAREYVRQLEAAMEYMRGDGFALLRSVFGGQDPTTSAGSGQLLILLARWDPSRGGGGSISYQAMDGMHSFVILNLSIRPEVDRGYQVHSTPAGRLRVLVHELAHAWQAQLSPGAADPAGESGGEWAYEGTAHLLANEAVRRYLEIPLLANWDWQAHFRDGDPTAAYALEPVLLSGSLSRGGEDGASFLRALQLRLIAHGSAPELALALVVRAALGDGTTARAGFAGLVAAMQSHLGTAWEPAESILQWAAAQGLDDRARVPGLDNPVFRDASGSRNQYGWKAAGELALLGGASLTVRRPSFSPFFVWIELRAATGYVAAEAGVGEARWLLVRAQ